MSLNEHLFHAM